MFQRDHKGMGVLAAAAAVMLLCGSTVLAGNFEQYLLGVEGIKAGSAPPPGFYLRNYFVYYTADTFTDARGGGDDGAFDLDIWASATRLIWITDQKILDADFGMDVVVPLLHTDITTPPGAVDSEFGLGDICVEPIILAWHGPRWDLTAAAGFYAPTGDYNMAESASPGCGRWTAMLTLGGTYYLDPEKTWSVSALMRYEIHAKQEETNVVRGNDLNLEWGVGKAVLPWLEVGVAGYCHWQTTEDSGPGTNDEQDQVFAVGPEIAGMVPDAPVMFSVRCLWEFAAEKRPEGFKGVVTITIPF